jgi:hypothetical protein
MIPTSLLKLELKFTLGTSCDNTPAKFYDPQSAEMDPLPISIGSLRD